jgi:hypothetical protein
VIGLRGLAGVVDEWDVSAGAAAAGSAASGRAATATSWYPCGGTSSASSLLAHRSGYGCMLGESVMW